MISNFDSFLNEKNFQVVIPHKQKGSVVANFKAECPVCSGLRSPEEGTIGLTKTERSPALALEIRGVETEQRTGL